MVAAFDVNDKKFQVTEDFKPDKGSTWTSKMEDDGWMHAHNAIRFENRSFIEMLEAVKERGGLKDWELGYLTKVWKGVLQIIEQHHHAEDDIFVPFLKTRFHYPEKCVTDHEGLHDLLNKIDAHVGKLKVGDTVDDLLKLGVELEEHMLPHLKQEEDECLPLTRAYFTAAEIGPKVQEVIAFEGGVTMGAIINTMGEQKFRGEFMKQEGIPFFVWYIQFMWQVRTYKKELELPKEALKAGKQ